jgi:hypothetical protein
LAPYALHDPKIHSLIKVDWQHFFAIVHQKSGHPNSHIAHGIPKNGEYFLTLDLLWELQCDGNKESLFKAFSHFTEGLI